MTAPRKPAAAEVDSQAPTSSSFPAEGDSLSPGLLRSPHGPDSRSPHFAPNSRFPQDAGARAADSSFIDHEVGQLTGATVGSIGDILAATNNLSAEQVAKVLAHQRKRKLKFGEAAVALGLVKSEDVMWALSQQFHYDYSPKTADSLNEELVVARDPFGPVAETFRDMRSQLMMTVLPEGEARALCVVSANEGDGKSFFSANLAVSFSQLGVRTLLIDANLRNPRQHNIFGLEMGGGLSSILSGRAAANVLRPVKELPNLFLLPAGPVPPNPLELVQRPAFSILLRELLHKFDHIVVDTPAAERGADARVIAMRCGAAVALGRTGTTRMSELQAFVTQITKNTQRFGGVVMNDF